MAWATGGFLGVDVFFVLSGYLITSLLLAEWERDGVVSLTRFWSRRARRLLPALLLLLFGVAAYAALALPGDQLASLRRDALATLAYVSNWHFILARRSYFARSAAPSLLQHTWSLAIEEQFYLVWPVVVVLVLRLRRRLPVDPAAKALLVVAGAGALASAAAMASMYHPATDPSRVYFGTDTHSQSVLAGATLAVALFCWSRRAELVRSTLWKAVGTAGLAFVAWACVTASPESSRLYRGGFLAVDVATAALIAAVVLQRTSLVARVLAAGPLRYTGAISYGLYLWHWPVFLVLNHAKTGLTGLALLVARVSVTFLISVASYHLVEMPVRRGKIRSSVAWIGVPAIAASTVVAVLAATTTPSAASLSGGGSNVAIGSPLASTTTVAATSPLVSRDALQPSPSPPLRKSLGVGSVARILIEADSVALTLGWDWGTAPTPGATVLDKGSIGCGVVQNTPMRDKHLAYVPPSWCATLPASWVNDVKTFNPDVVVLLVGRWEVLDHALAGQWTSMGNPAFDMLVANELQRAILELSSRGAPVVLLTMPCMSSGEQPNGAAWPQDDPRRVDRFNAVLRDVAQHSGGRAQIIDLESLVCPQGRYAAKVGGVDVRASDGVHFSHSGSIWLASLLVHQILQLARRA